MGASWFMDSAKKETLEATKRPRKGEALESDNKD